MPKQEENLVLHVINQYNTDTNKARNNIHQQVTRTTIRRFGKYAIIKNNKLVAKSINEIIRINDAIDIEQAYVEDKYSHRVNRSAKLEQFF